MGQRFRNSSPKMGLFSFVRSCIANTSISSSSHFLFLVEFDVFQFSLELQSYFPTMKKD